MQHPTPLLTRLMKTKISDLVQIAPEDFSKHSIVAIEDNINAKYANKVHSCSQSHLDSGSENANSAIVGHSEDWTVYLSV